MPTSAPHTSLLPAPGDFGGACLIGECVLDADALLPSTSYHGLQKTGSYLYGTWRDDDGNLIRAMRAVRDDSSPMRHIFAARPGGQLERDNAEHDLWAGRIAIDRSGDVVTFRSVEAEQSSSFAYTSEPDACRWTEAEILAVSGRSIGPAVQWFNTWTGGACLTLTAKYRSSGTIIGRRVEGFSGHEIHYFSPGANWMQSPFGAGREFCWQHVANEYDDGSIVQATFASGADGWGFAMVHEDGTFVASTEVDAEATVRANGHPETITYRFLDQTWTWRIDPQGERADIGSGAMIGADGTCQRDGDPRAVRLSMGNSDWWTDGRATPILRPAQPQ